MNSVALTLHIAAGAVCLLVGLVALLAAKRKGLHTVLGETYHASYVLVFLSAVILSLLNWPELAHLFFIGIFSYGLALIGYVARKRRRPGWLGWHISGLVGSYIGVLTAVLVTNGPNLPGFQALPPILYWFLPTVVGSPLIARTVARHVGGTIGS